MEGMKCVSNKQARATVDMKDDDGCTPLYMAAQKGHPIVVDALLKACNHSDATTAARP